MNRRSFLTSLTAILVAPLAAAKIVSRPSPPKPLVLQSHQEQYQERILLANGSSISWARQSGKTAIRGQIARQRWYDGKQWIPFA